MAMNIIKLIIRAGALLLLVLLGITAVFPEWLDLKDFLVSEYKPKLQDAQKREKSGQSKPPFPCPSEPVIHKAKDSLTTATTNNMPARTDDDTPKVLINRDPRAFDRVCEEDTLQYFIYAENIDRMMISYQNDNDRETASYEIKQPVDFKTPMKFSMPKGWVGNTTIEAMGFTTGRVALASSKVTFNIARRNLNKAPGEQKEQIAKIVLPSFKLKWKNSERAENSTRIQIVDRRILYIASHPNNIDSWRMKIDLKEQSIAPGSRILLTNDTTDIWTKKLSPSKRHEPVLIKNVSGTLVTEESINGHYVVKLEVIASDQTLPGTVEYTPTDGVYYIKGSALVAE